MKNTKDWILEAATRDEKIELIRRALKRLEQGLNMRVQFDIITFTIVNMKNDYEKNQ
jgi:hypothetical protein